MARRLIDQPSNNPSCADDVLVDLETPEASLLLRVISPESYRDFGSETCRPAPMPLASEARVSDEDVSCIEKLDKGSRASRA